MSAEKLTYKHIIVPVPMAEAYETKTIRRQTGTRTVDRQKGLLNPKKVTVEEPVYEYVEEPLPTGRLSDCDIDNYATGQAIEEACNTLAAEGYDVISITPLLRGAHHHQFSTGAQQKGTGPGGFGYGYGYSVTDSIVIVGRIKSDN